MTNLGAKKTQQFSGRNVQKITPSAFSHFDEEF